MFCSYSLYRVFGTVVLVLSDFPLLTRYNIFLGITGFIPNSVQNGQAGHDGPIMRKMNVPPPGETFILLVGGSAPKPP